MFDGKVAPGPILTSRALPAAQLEVWGGIECSVVRVRDMLRDQFRETGHHDRIADLEEVRALGVRTLRYPVSWERVAPDQPEECGWAWHEERLAEMRRIGIKPIVGFVHHGSGPAYTCLSDPRFPEKLADYAGRVARRFPWVEDWTPVNEPLTTARFSGLYGHWHPHRSDEASFIFMVALQCRAVLLAMRAIREVNPAARLVQTEDLGRTFATPELQYQADYENERRWLSLDLLAGRINPAHGWWGRCLASGVPQAWLEDFLAGDLAPMVFGLNYYITSERFLDQRLPFYPGHTHGGNGRHAYADTEAARVPMPAGLTGWLPRLRDAWHRYPEVPLAVTEVHLGCQEREEQVRWLNECWQAAETLRAEGADLRAVTPWALFGAVDWCSLLTQRRGRYEAGAFDTSGGSPRRTLLAEGVQALATRGTIEHRALRTPGWWRRDTRFHSALRTM
ncbi:MAG TPA: family 1 glycosylhydrolase [Acetobacteraceae bacterium]|nr:family 1 glycosylhydrolase [Acetobacteraceae bacterium]